MIIRKGINLFPPMVSLCLSLFAESLRHALFSCREVIIIECRGVCSVLDQHVGEQVLWGCASKILGSKQGHDWP